MRLLKLAHVDGDEVSFAAVKRVRQRKRRFCFAHAARTRKKKHADGFVRILQTGARSANALRDLLQRVGLANNARTKWRSSPRATATSSLSIFPTGMPVQAEITSPMVWLSTHTRTSGALALQRLQFHRERVQLRPSLRAGFGTLQRSVRMFSNGGDQFALL